MTVQELIDALSAITRRDAEVILAIDEEGNEFKRIDQVEVNSFRSPVFDEWRVDLVALEDEDDNELEFDEDERAIIIWPVG